MKRLPNNVRGFHRNRYTEEDHAAITRMLAEGKRAWEIAAALKRTANSLYVYCHKRGISLRIKLTNPESIKRKERRIRALLKEQANATDAEHS